MTLNSAFLEALEVAAAPAPVYDGKVPVDSAGAPLEDRYAVLYSSAPHRSSDDLGHTSDGALCRWQVTSVGLTREQAEWVADRCQRGVIDRRLNVPGYVTGPVEHVYGGEWTRRDDDTPGQERFVAVDTYRLIATTTES